jgi:hypothetical protein
MPKDKNKLYNLYAKEAERIIKGKSRRPYEFGVKAIIAVTHKQGLIIGSRSFPGHVRPESSVTIDRNDRSRWSGNPSRQLHRCLEQIRAAV